MWRVPCVACSLPSPVATQFYVSRFITNRKPLPFTTKASGIFLGLPCASCGFLVLPGASWCFLELPGASWGFLGLLGGFWGILGFPGASWGLLGLRGASWDFLVVRGASWALRERCVRECCIMLMLMRFVRNFTSK